MLFHFDRIVKSFITKLKYYARKDIAKFFGNKLYLSLISHPILCSSDNSNLIISYVPSYWYSVLKKWYNQSELLATELHRRIPHSTFLKICSKTKWTRSQVWLTRAQRKYNLEWAFSLVPTHIPKWSIVVIVDDVLTTWSTLLEMAKTIKKSQSDCLVRWLCVARNA